MKGGDGYFMYGLLSSSAIRGNKCSKLINEWNGMTPPSLIQCTYPNQHHLYQ
jgi:hypothetical protein